MELNCIRTLTYPDTVYIMFMSQQVGWNVTVVDDQKINRKETHGSCHSWWFQILAT